MTDALVAAIKDRVDPDIYADLAGVSPARPKQRHKYECPVPGCGSSDAFDIQNHRGCTTARCFSCGWPSAAGNRATRADVITLVMDLHQVSFVDAVKQLAGELGFDVDADETQFERKRLERVRQKLEKLDDFRPFSTNSGNRIFRRVRGELQEAS